VYEDERPDYDVPTRPIEVVEALPEDEREAEDCILVENTKN
jgi:hypothetical protein